MHAITLTSPNDLEMLSHKLAPALKPGDLITLDGPLGSGKTTFTQSLCKALDVQEAVNSPSFGLVNEYISGKIPVAHLDLYRLGPEKAHQLWDELALYLDEARHVILIEWATYGEGFPIDLYKEATLRITLDYVSGTPDARQLTVQGNTSILQQCFRD